jgi:hypothetical protein
VILTEPLSAELVGALQYRERGGRRTPRVQVRARAVEEPDQVRLRYLVGVSRCVVPIRAGGDKYVRKQGLPGGPGIGNVPPTAG